MPDFRLLESHLAGDFLHHCARLIQQLEFQAIQYRRFTSPLVGVRDERREFHRLLSLTVHRESVGCQLLHLVALGVGQRGANSVGTLCVLIFLHIHLHLHRGIPVLVVKVGGHVPVEEARLGCGIERHIVEDASQSPVVLTFQIITVTILHHTNSQHVLAGLQIGSHVIFSRFLSTLVIAYLLTVQPHKRAALCFLHTQEHLLSLPVGRQGEGLAISARWVIISRHKRRIRSEGSRHIAELRIAISLHLPVAGHMDGVPLAVLEVRLKESLRHLLGRVGKEETPIAIQRQMFLGKVISMSLLLVLLKHRGVLDVVIDMLQILSARLQRASCKQTNGKMFNVHIVYFFVFSTDRVSFALQSYNKFSTSNGIIINKKGQK